MPASGKPNVGYQDLVSLIFPLTADSPSWGVPAAPPSTSKSHEEGELLVCYFPQSAKIYSDWMGLGHVSPPESVTEARGMLHAAGFSRVTSCTPESEKEVDPRMATRALPR